MPLETADSKAERCPPPGRYVVAKRPLGSIGVSAGRAITIGGAASGGDDGDGDGDRDAATGPCDARPATRPALFPMPCPDPAPAPWPIVPIEPRPTPS